MASLVLWSDNCDDVRVKLLLVILSVVFRRDVICTVAGALNMKLRASSLSSWILSFLLPFFFFSHWRCGNAGHLHDREFQEYPSHPLDSHVVSKRLSLGPTDWHPGFECLSSVPPNKMGSDWVGAWHPKLEYPFPLKLGLWRTWSRCKRISSAR